LANISVLIVEDEEFFASEVQDILNKLGYDVSGIASTGEDAVKMTEETHPDLVLMDIVLKGEMDGVTAAEQIHERLDIPVISITGLTGHQITESAKITEPFGYILKPFQERELHVAIEIALYRHKMEKKFREISEEREKYTADLERMNKLMIGRELKMEELKKKNERLKELVEELESKIRAGERP